MIRRLREFPVPPPLRPVWTQCSQPARHHPAEDRWRQHRYGGTRLDPDRCVHPGVVEIDGKPYCRRHAGQIALDRWLAGTLTEAK